MSQIPQADISFHHAVIKFKPPVSMLWYIQILAIQDQDQSNSAHQLPRVSSSLPLALVHPDYNDPGSVKFNSKFNQPAFIQPEVIGILKQQTEALMRSI